MKTLKTLIKSKLLSTATSFAKDEKGNFAIIGAVTIAMLIAGLAVSIDLASGYSAKQRLQDTTDAIALMAARGEISGQTNLTAAAQEYFDLTYPGQNGARINLESITRDGDAVTVVASNNIDTYFAGIFGVSGLDVTTASTAEYASTNLNLSLVLDTTGSMRGSKLATLKVAGNALINQLSSIPDDQLNVSVVPFAQYVNVGENLAGQNWLEFPQTGGRAPRNWNGCVGSRQGNLNTRINSRAQRIPGLVGVNCPTPVQPLTQNMNTVKQSINNLKAEGFTYMPAGIAWGWRTLTPQAPFTQTRGQNPEKTEKIMILMTDGTNTRSASGMTHEGQSQRNADRTTAEICENVKRDDIKVFTIAYEISDVGTQNLLRDCATDAGSFFNASNASQLTAAFQEIGASLSVTRITS